MKIPATIGSFDDSWAVFPTWMAEGLGGAIGELALLRDGLWSQTSLQIQVLQDIPELDPRFAFFPLVTSLLGDPFLLVGLFWISVPWVRAEN